MVASSLLAGYMPIHESTASHSTAIPILLIVLHRYVTESDLAYLKERIEDDKSPEGSGDWEPMMDKDLGRCTYTAWRQCLPVSCLHH